jgi:hypothetical protein|uniref:Peptidase A1 domain-containing protein n=1 Tax=Globisporangium ultimum (strain ATCC 200006 / CBS 805.95 / DAOM BR144) TaxID=431595 RepID=K3XBF0_GLOUD
MQFGDFTIQQQLFAEVNNTINYPEYPRTAFDGLISLRRDTTPIDPFCSPSPFHRLVDSGVLEKPVFAFYYEKGVGGELTIGDVDNSHYTGEITYVPLEVSYDWRIQLDTISVNGKNMSKVGIAWIMTMLPVIIGPHDEVEALAKIVAASANNKYEIDCSSSGPEIAIVIGGTKFTLTKDDYTLRTKGSTVCHWAFNPSSLMGNGWMLGIPFVEKFYTIFDWGAGAEFSTDGRVGIALRA